MTATFVLDDWLRPHNLLTFEAEWDEELLVSIQLYSEKLTEKWFTKQTSEVNDYLPLKYKKRDLF